MISGKFDLETEAAVINFQKANNLQVDGVVGPLSWACLFYPRLYRNQKSMSPKLQDAVKELQTILNQEGFFKKEPDGYFSRETERGVKLLLECLPIKPSKESSLPLLQYAPYVLTGIFWKPIINFLGTLFN